MNINVGQRIELWVQLSTHTGLTPTYSMYRKSDGLWLQSGGTWGASKDDISLAQKDPTNEPGYYNDFWTNDKVDIYKVTYDDLFITPETKTETYYAGTVDSTNGPAILTAVGNCAQADTTKRNFTKVGGTQSSSNRSFE